MAEEAKVDAQVAESKATPEKTVEETPKTIGEMVGETIEAEKKESTVPSHEFVAIKKALKTAEKELKSLKASIEDGASKKEIADDISAIADEHNIDKGFLQKLASSIKAEAEKEMDAKLASKFESKEKQEKFDDVFSKAYEKALERAPDFKSISNPEIIKVLATQPQNSKKTISQLLEETYGNAITGKRTIETTSPGGGKDPEPLDFKRAEKDISYFKEVMADPKKKAEYNAQMLSRGF